MIQPLSDILADHSDFAMVHPRLASMEYEVPLPCGSCLFGSPVSDIIFTSEAYSRYGLQWVPVVSERARVVAAGGDSAQITNQARFCAAYVAQEVSDIRMALKAYGRGR